MRDLDITLSHICLCETSISPAPTLCCGRAQGEGSGTLQVPNPKAKFNFVAQVDKHIGAEALSVPSPYLETVDFLDSEAVANKKVEHWRQRFCGKQRKATVSILGEGEGEVIRSGPWYTLRTEPVAFSEKSAREYSRFEANSQTPARAFLEPHN